MILSSSVSNSKYFVSYNKKIGAGATSEVFCGKDQDGTRVAIKVVAERHAKLADKEISYCTLAHPYIVPILAHGCLEDGVQWIVTPLAPQGDLYNFVKKTGAMEIDKVALLGKQLLSAIAYLAEKKICHGDIKPHNLLYNELEEKLQLCDFGCAVNLADNPHRDKLAYALFYKPPEVLLGLPWSDADVWAAGASLFYLYAGQRLFFDGHPNSNQLQQDQADLLCQIEKMVGPLPLEMAREVGPQRAHLLSQPPKNSHWGQFEYFARSYLQGIPFNKNLVSEHWKETPVRSIDERVADKPFASLLKQMIQYQRPPAAELLKNPFFS